MTRVDLHPEELLDRVRSGTASSEDEARLRAHLASCTACRLEHTLALDGLRSAAEQPGDAAVLERIRAGTIRAFQRARVPGAGRSTRQRSRRVRVLAAAIVFFGAIGAAAVFLRVRDEQTHAPGPVPAVMDAARSSRAMVPSPPPAASLEAPPATPTEDGTAPHAEKRHAAVEPRSPAVDVAKSSSASAEELFARANLQRRSGETAEAVRTYRELAQSFPTSDEALISRVSLGRLLLDRLGNAKAALGEFDAYLARAPRGALSEEALIGRALCLGRLGNAPEEEKAWRRLLSEHPGSTYAARARSRLERLSSQ
jgi:tetratricopeptide (TPR) repeat protein